MASNRDNALKSHYVVIDSRSRDAMTYPNPSHYDVRLSTEIRDVVSMRILRTAIPNTPYNVTSKNNTIQVSFPNIIESASNPTCVTIQEGVYNKGPDLATAVALALSGISSAIFRVDYNDVTDKIVIWSSTPVVWFSTSNICYTAARVLGFPNGIAVSSVNASEIGRNVDDPALQNVTIAPYRIDLCANKRFVSIHVWQPSIDIITSSVSCIDNAFAIIPWPRNIISSECHVVDMITSTDSDFKGSIKIWDPPLASIAKIGISLRDDDGDFVDFQNHDHTIEFIVETLPNSMTRRYA